MMKPVNDNVCTLGFPVCVASPFLLDTHTILLHLGLIDIKAAGIFPHTFRRLLRDESMKCSKMSDPCCPKSPSAFANVYCCCCCEIHFEQKNECAQLMDLFANTSSAI